MSSLCKTVKIIALLMLAMGILSIAIGIFTFATAPDSADELGMGIVTGRVSGIIMIATGVLYLVSGVSGALGANNPSKLGSFTVLCAVIAVANAICAGLAIAGTGIGSALYNIAYALVPLAAAVCAVRAKKDAADRLL